MRTIWNEQRLQRLFWRYNRRFFGDALKGWTVDTDELHQGLYGCCNEKIGCISIRLPSHTSDHLVRSTLVHEMAHAATNSSHGRRWESEIEQLKAAEGLSRGVQDAQTELHQGWNHAGRWLEHGHASPHSSRCA